MEFKTGLTIACFICVTVSVGNVRGADSSDSSIALGHTTAYKAEISKSCRKIDAGLRWHGTLYLFSEDQYMEFDVNNTETLVGDVTDWGDDMPSNIDAAVQWTGNYRHYFFKGSDYWSYRFLDVSGPWNTGYWWHHYIDGDFDATGNRLGATYFFKGCTYRTWESYSTGVSGEMQPEVGIPCDLDAAWDYEDNWDDLVLAKNNKIWIWGEQLDGPFEFSSIYNVTSWKICSS